MRASSLRLVIPALAGLLLALAAPATLRAAIISAGNVTTALGPSFFIDEASNGGGDADIVQPAVPSYMLSFGGPLTRNQGPTRVTLTGLGFTAHTSLMANSASKVAVTFTYLGADQAVGGGDDVVIGTATGTYKFTGGGEYVFVFDKPLVADLNITGTMFRIQIAPSNASGNGSLKLKTRATGNFQPKLSVAGVAEPVHNPGQVNQAKSKAVITAGNVRADLGPTFFINEASDGGGDADIVQPSVPGYLRMFSGLLTCNQGPTRITLTGLGFAAHKSAKENNASTVAVTFTYLGADQVIGGGDDVVIGTATGTYNFTGGGEYVFVFDKPLVADLNITGTMFLIQIAPSNASGKGSLKLKTPAIGNHKPKLSVAGFVAPVINPERGK